MKKLIFLMFVIFFGNLSFAQEWNSNAPDIIFAENANNNLTPIKIGIGTDVPSAQLHTTGGVRLQGLPVSTIVPQSIVGSDNNGNLSHFSSGLLNDNEWHLTGNVANATHFIGTLNNEDFRIRTNNTQRMVIKGNTGFVGINSSSPLVALDLRYSTNNVYNPEMASNPWESNGALIYNNSTGESESTYASILLASRDHDRSWMGVSSINSLSPGPNLSAITFQTEINAGYGGRLRERLRITETGTVEINIQQNGDNELALRTDGNLKFQNLPITDDFLNILIIDDEGNVFRAESTTTFSCCEDVESLLSRIEELERQMEEIKSVSPEERTRVSPKKTYSLSQNVPNPSQGDTKIEYSITGDFKQAELMVYTINGLLVTSYDLEYESGEVVINGGVLENGLYSYGLVVDGDILETKKMLINYLH